MKLNYKIQGDGKPIILLHGLFGSLDNLGILARALCDEHQVIQVDLRNHGLSFWSDEMNYRLMAQDVIRLINDFAFEQVTLIGHSMGGKVAMTIADIEPDLIDKLIVLDIAPVTYQADSHQRVFDAINHVIDLNISDRKAISQIMSEYLTEATVQFLLKSYKDEKWLFNFKSLENHYEDIRGWQQIAAFSSPVLFIKGGDSHYIIDSYQAEIIQQFPYAVIETLDGAGHNVHFEKPQQVLELIKQWL